MVPKHIPIRTCVACRTSGDKRGLLRVVRQPDGVVVHDQTGKLNGRGAYICASETCIATARKKKSLDRSLKTATPPELYDALLARAREPHLSDAGPGETQDRTPERSEHA